MRLLRTILPALPLALLGACGPRTFEPSWETPPPNVLLLSVDTLRADHLGHNGYERDTSPRLDALASRSVVFDNAQASTSWTLPGLASAVTGLYTSTHSCWSFASRLDPSFHTLAEYLLAYGYDTASVSSHMFLSQVYGLQQGIVHYDDRLLQSDINPDEAISSPIISDQGIRFLEQKAAAPDGHPWLLWLHYFDPHDEYVPHEGISERFLSPSSEEPFAQHRDLYDGEIFFTDLHIGRVLDALAANGFAENTIVVFFSDHGEEFGDHGRMYHGHTLFDELTRVPFTIRAPGFEHARVSSLVRTVDILPTVLELVGHPVPEGLPGQSLQALMRGEGFVERPALTELRLRVDEAMEAYQSGPWKLVRHLERGAPVFLYDLAADPGQLVDVAADHPEIVEELTRKLRGSVAGAVDAAEGYEKAEELDLTPEMMRILEDLGYAEGRR